MAYTLQILPAAAKTLARLPRDVKKRVDVAILGLSSEPRPAGARALKGASVPLLRVRVGDYRVVYEVRDEIVTVLVVRIGHRREVYR